MTDEIKKNESTEAKRVDMPIRSRLASISTINEEKRTVELVWTTGAQVRRYDWSTGRDYMEELALDGDAVDMARLNNGAPLLNTHSRWELTDVLGVVEKAWLSGGEGRALVRFSERDDVEPIFKDVKGGIIRNVSVGYNVKKYLKIERDNEIPIYRAIEWEPMELSLVPIGADAGAGTRAESRSAIQRVSPCIFIDSAESAITRKETAMSGANAAPADEKAGNTTVEQQQQDQQRAMKEAADKARAQEKERQTSIRDLVRVSKLDGAFAEDLISKDIAIEEARKLVFEKMDEQSKVNDVRNAHNTIKVVDNSEQYREAMEVAIMNRSDPRIKLTDQAREYRGMSLLDMARECIERAGGKSRGLTRREIAGAALNNGRLQARAGMMSTSDFPYILGNTINRTLRQAYDLQPRTFLAWAKPATAPDFRDIARGQLSELSKFQKVNEGGEYKYLYFGETSEKYSLAKYGGIIALTWEAIVNDDLNAFGRIPLMIAGEAAQTEGDIVYGILTGNPNMADGNALFSVAHANLAGSGGAISETTLGAARAALRKQTGPGGRILNLSMAYLIVGPDKELEAYKYTSPEFAPIKQSDIVPKQFRNLTVVVDGRITGNQWFLAAEPTLVDTIEYAHLEGEEGIYTEERWGFEVDGVEVKARDVFAAKAIDWRGLYKNPGA